MVTRVSVFSVLTGLMLLGLAGATTVAAQVVTANSPVIPPTTQVVEWDVSSAYNGDGTCTPPGFCVDAQPGAVAVDKRGENSALWFVTRGGDFRILRLQPNSATKNSGAQWTSWQLDSSGITTGGIKRLKISDDGHLAVARTVDSVQIVDTSNCWNTMDNSTIPATVQTVCKRTEYQDMSAAMISDVAIDRNYYVYTAVSVADPQGVVNNQIERLDPSTGNLTLWTVGGGAGNCPGASDPGTSNFPCMAGIAVHPKNSNLVYFSEPDSNSIGELNTSTNAVRQWSLNQNFSNGPVSGPRQLNIDQDGIIWVVTGSGHLVSLDPQRNLMSAHLLPDNAAADPFGVAPDSGFVGYTASNSTVSKVGMLVPTGKAVYVCPTPPACVPVTCAHANVICGQAVQNCGAAPTYVKTVSVDSATVPNDGTYIEAQIAVTPYGSPNGVSTTPLGIGSHQGKGVGTFFYAVGVATSTSVAVDRVGFVRLPRMGFKAKHEREDKDCKDDGSDQDDQDHDGIPNQNETSDSNAHMDRQNDQLAPGQSSTYTLTAASTTKALVATITADNPLAAVSIEIDDPNGVVLAVPVATPGMAVATAIPTVVGDYTVRVTNAGAAAINHETDLLAREPLSLF